MDGAGAAPTVGSARDAPGWGLEAERRGVLRGTPRAQGARPRPPHHRRRRCRSCPLRRSRLRRSRNVGMQRKMRCRLPMPEWRRSRAQARDRPRPTRPRPTLPRPPPRPPPQPRSPTPVPDPTPTAGATAVVGESGSPNNVHARGDQLDEQHIGVHRASAGVYPAPPSQTEMEARGDRRPLALPPTLLAAPSQRTARLPTRNVSDDQPSRRAHSSDELGSSASQPLCRTHPPRCAAV